MPSWGKNAWLLKLFQVLNYQKKSNRMLPIKIEHYRAQGKTCTRYLLVILVGADPASQVYVGSKRKKLWGNRDGFLKSYDLPETTTEAELLQLIDQLNADESIDGILVQLPLPEQINSTSVIERISPEKMWMVSTLIMWDVYANVSQLYVLAPLMAWWNY